MQYYLNSEETKLVTEAFETEKTQAADQVAAMEETISVQKSSKGRISLLPENVSILECRLENHQLILNLNGAYYDMDRAKEILVRAGLVKSFVQLDNVDEVLIQVEGLGLKNSDGQDVGPMDTKDFVETEGREIDAYQYGTFTLYFANAEGDGLVREVRKVYYSTSVPMEREVVELLIQGPLGEDAQATMPSNLGILSVNVSDGIAYVNLDNTFVSGALALPDDLIIYSLVNSLVEGSGVERVQISVNGETNVSFRNSVDLNQFFEENLTLVEDVDE
jgi:germination protein M